jgi:SAM-dependent methyltransferase
MEIEKFLEYIKPPDSDSETEFVIAEDHLLDKKNNVQYPIIHNMIDFQGSISTHARVEKTGILFWLNTFYGNHLDPWIRTSILAGGGAGFINSHRKMKQWIDKYQSDKILFIEPEDNRLISYIGDESCLTVEDFESKNVFPLETDYPNINASPVKLPICSASFQSILSNFVLEHVKDPRQHIRELERILKPGGYVIIGGPGDVYPSHRIPYNYFNIIRYGYFEMFKEFGLELVEEYFPAKSWMSILYIVYTITVRNSWFNRNQITKLIQLPILVVSFFLSPVFNLLALLMDLITPFDKRVYSVYMAVLKKPVSN